MWLWMCITDTSPSRQQHLRQRKKSADVGTSYIIRAKIQQTVSTKNRLKLNIPGFWKHSHQQRKRWWLQLQVAQSFFPSSLCDAFHLTSAFSPYKLNIIYCNFHSVESIQFKCANFMCIISISIYNVPRISRKLWWMVHFLRFDIIFYLYSWLLLFVHICQKCRTEDQKWMEHFHINSKYAHRIRVNAEYFRYDSKSSIWNPEYSQHLPKPNGQKQFRLKFSTSPICYGWFTTCYTKRVMPSIFPRHSNWTHKK